MYMIVTLHKKLYAARRVLTNNKAPKSIVLPWIKCLRQIATSAVCVKGVCTDWLVTCARVVWCAPLTSKRCSATAWMNHFSSSHTRLRVMFEKVVRRNTVSLVRVVISFSMNWLWRKESAGRKGGNGGGG